jgi:hypothetical protein
MWKLVSEFGFILYVIIHHLLNHSETLRLVPKIAIMFFYTSLSTDSNEFLNSANNFVVEMEMECIFCAVEETFVIGHIIYVDVGPERLQM